MNIPVTQAKAQLTDLVRRAEAGEPIILTRHGRAAVQLEPVEAAFDPAVRRRALEALRGSALGGPDEHVSAARSQDFLYGEDGLPG